MGKPDERILHTADTILNLLLQNGIRIHECNDVFYVAYKRFDQTRKNPGFADKEIYFQKENPNKEFLTVKEAAEYFGVTVQTVYNKCQDGVLPYVRIGNRYRIFQNRIFGALIRQEEKEKKLFD
ncbi:hypothetical protein FACS189419_05060 [Planctomycetales bacterium]|nr:hypothetical protein FACS189419_05060 [Planctomycetales bacterium]